MSEDECEEDVLLPESCMCKEVLCRRNNICVAGTICAGRCYNQYYDYTVTEEFCACASWEGYASRDITKEIVYKGGICTYSGEAIERCILGEDLSQSVCKCGENNWCTGKRTQCKNVKYEGEEEIYCIREAQDITTIVMSVILCVLITVLVITCGYEASADSEVGRARLKHKTIGKGSKRSYKSQANEKCDNAQLPAVTLQLEDQDQHPLTGQ